MKSIFLIERFIGQQLVPVVDTWTLKRGTALYGDAHIFYSVSDISGLKQQLTIDIQREDLCLHPAVHERKRT